MPFVIARICVSQEANEVPSASPFSIKEFFESDNLLTLDQLQQLEYAAGTSQLTEIRQVVGDLTRRVEAGEKRESVVARAGVGAYVLSRQSQADRLLATVSADGVALFAHGQCLTSLGRPDEAAARFEAASRLGVDPVGCALRRAGAIRAAGRVDEAEKLLRSVAASAASRAEYSFQMGCIWADRGDSLTAVEYFERAVDMDPHHSRALFWLAAENALRGNDDEAIRLYERSLSRPPFYIGALLNLGLLYEDRENYQAAAFCFRRVREYDPNNQFAELYLKDIEATQGMYYDEDHAKQEARMKQLLGRPVTDFELSVRSRNCLQAMNIVTLGDLTEVSEQELLAGKNFGETSLMEIRELLQAHGLRIGQHLHKIHSREHIVDQSLSPEEQAMMNKLVTDLNLSVRSRKCMSRLNIQTVGQLCQRTPDELLASRNFGVTSLNEIREKLKENGMRLRND
jgi:DNA-directed RNA polymerase subunit alpha